MPANTANATSTSAVTTLTPADRPAAGTHNANAHASANAAAPVDCFGHDYSFAEATTIAAANNVRPTPSPNPAPIIVPITMLPNNIPASAPSAVPHRTPPGIASLPHSGTISGGRGGAPFARFAAS